MRKMNIKSPNEVLDYLIDVSTEKGNKSVRKLEVLGFIAGMFIGFGAVGSIIASSTLAKTNPGLAKFVAGAVFPVGLILVLLLGVELFTSNCMLIVAVISKRMPLKKLLKNWITVYTANFLGITFVSFLTILTHNFNNDALVFLEKLALYKISAPAYELFLKGILCNVLVCGGVLMAYAAKDAAGKIFAAWFSIMLFTILGYDHCIANMLYLTAAKFAGFAVPVSGIVYNLFFVTLGNIVGGTLFMAIPFYLSNRRKKVVL